MPINNAQDFIESMARHAELINADLQDFMNAEMSQGRHNDANTVKVTAYDIMYKFLWMAYKNDLREVLANIPDGAVWQASDNTVYEKTQGEMINLKLVDYLHKVQRSCRIGEDRKGYLVLSDKRAEELGYTPPKKASL